jgi:hypothetical protein
MYGAKNNISYLFGYRLNNNPDDAHKIHAFTFLSGILKRGGITRNSQIWQCTSLRLSCLYIRYKCIVKDKNNKCCHNKSTTKTRITEDSLLDCVCLSCCHAPDDGQILLSLADTHRSSGTEEYECYLIYWFIREKREGDKGEKGIKE